MIGASFLLPIFATEGGDLLARTDVLIGAEVEHVLALLCSQNRLICRVILATGLRIGDVVSLRREDIRPQVWITESKTGKRRHIGFDADLRRQILAQSGSYWAFPGRKAGQHKTRQAVWADIHRAAQALRMPLVAGPHSLRKTYAVDLMHRYGDLQRVRRALQHDNDAVTVIYAMADHIRESRIGAR